MAKRTRILLLTLAGALLMGALLLNASIGKNSRLSALARELAVYGYDFTPEDLYVAQEGHRGTIGALMEAMDLTAAAEASAAAGFPSRLDREGLVELVLAALVNGDVVTVFLLDGQIELAFVQRPETELVYPLGSTPEAGE